MKATQVEIVRVNRAIEAVAKRLDRLETICAKNNSPLRGVYFTNSPDTEFSKFRVVYRSERARTKK